MFLLSFTFLTGFVPITAVLGPAVTVASSGNIVKATAQLVFDNEFKKKTGKSSLSYIKEEVSKNNEQKNIDNDFKEMIEKRVKVVHQKLVDQNKVNKNFKLLIEKRVELTHKKLIQQKINQ
tara:strand:- start:36 stop:398 length:363 start_codon:yes stop_codon:yes gene_type:complete